MTTRSPLVLADDGLIEQLQVGDNLPESDATAQLLIQNNAIIRLLVSMSIGLCIKQEALDDDDVEDFVGDLTP